MFSDIDFAHMQRALALAARGMSTTTPNPRVGCVIVKHGEVIGEGHTQPPGQDHAEVQALKDARARGHDVAGSTVYVTLEPCSHFGRTPPCANALIEARVAKVVAAMEDPNPLVSGRGLGMLRDAGIDVRCGLLAHEAGELNIGFVSRMTRGRPWVRMKAAASLDGRTALPSGESQWITGEAARADGHAWRARACAILTGIGTVREDDPQLTVRGIDTPRQPQRVLVDSRLELPLDARLLEGAPLLIFCGRLDADGEARASALKARGAEIVSLANAHGKVDLGAMLSALGARGINELHVEAGHKLNGSLLRERCVDELLVYLAPSLLGADAAGMFDLAAPASLDARTRLTFHHIERIGDDLRILARIAPPPPLIERNRHDVYRNCRGSRPHRIDQSARRVAGRRRAADRERRRPRPRGRRARRQHRDPGRLHDRDRQDRHQLRRRRVARKPEPHGRARAAGRRQSQKALRAHDRLGGHIVSGHVDGLGTVSRFAPVGESHELRIVAPRELGRYLAYKGSITVNGVSLTVNAVEDRPDGSEFSINLIPHTVEVTTLRHLKAGDQVNLEVDMIARYVERMLTMSQGASQD